MSGNDIKRRDFLKVMGWSGVGVALSGCDMPTTVTLEEGEEEVTSYLSPEEYVVPGLGVWYASTCPQCPAGCGIHGRVREGRVLKLEGNPDSPINKGKLCQMGQAGLQGHYNPDRVTRPLLRRGGELQEVSWDEAMEALNQRVGPGANVAGERIAWFTGTVSGHQRALIQAHLETVGGTQHYTHEVIHDAVNRQVNADLLGDPRPRYRFDKAEAILSLGADFLGTGVSLIHFSTEYADFRGAFLSPAEFSEDAQLRTKRRGVLVQVEPKMTLTGANADLWVPPRPGTEGALALGVANVLTVRHRVDAKHLPEAVQELIQAYDLNRTSEITGVPGDRIVKIAGWLNDRSPSLVLAGASAEGHPHGYEIVAAAMILNMLLGNVGETIEPGPQFPFPQLTPAEGSTQDLMAFADKAKQGGLEAVFFYNTNPAYTAPDFVGIDEVLGQIPFKVAFAQFPDETSMAADLVLPIHSLYEDWGTHVAAYQPSKQAILGVRQPLMEPVHDSTKGFGDIMLELLKARDPDNYGDFDDYYAYLRKSFNNMPAEAKQGTANDEAFWRQALQQGMLRLSGGQRSFNPQTPTVELPTPSDDSEYPYYLVPSPRLGLWDGRYANIPWLQEAPDQITKVVWDSWAELHPDTAAKLGVEEGDALRVESDQGALEVKVTTHRGIHKEAVAVPLGQGHSSDFSRYAHRGVNPLKILNPVQEKRTGELAQYATRVRLSKAAPVDALVQMGGTDTQMGRKLVASVTADVFERTEIKGRG